MKDLIKAAEVFSFVIPNWIDDFTVVGKVCGVEIHAGEIRRLQAALSNATLPFPQSGDDQILAFLCEGSLVEAIKYRRNITGDYLKVAKEYVEELGLRHNLRRKTKDGYEWIIL